MNTKGMIESVIAPKRPVVQGWRRARWRQCPAQLAELGYPVEAWEHSFSCLFALSAVEVVAEAHGPDLGPEYHLSLSFKGGPA